MMDKIDKNILDALQHDASLSNQALADYIALSPTPCLRRTRMLEKQGYIKKKVAILDAEKLGLELSVMCLVELKEHTPEVMEDFQAHIQTIPEVMQCYLITGQTADYLLQVVIPDLKAFEYFLLKKLTKIPGVANVHSSFVLKKICDKTQYPLDQLRLSKQI